MNNPIQYTSRTFQTILADINSDKELADKPEWFKRMIAGIGDVMSMCLDAQANNSYLETAFTRDAVKKLCQLIGYTLGVRTTSSGKLKFYLSDTTVFPITVLAKDLCAVYGRVSSMRFESRSDVTLNAVTTTLAGTSVGDHITVTDPIPFETYDKVYVTGGLTGYYYLKIDGSNIYFANSVEDIDLERWVTVITGSYTFKLYTITVQCYQQEQKDAVTIGSSDGNTAWQTFILPDADVLQDTLVITINDEVWTRVDDFSESVATSKHYRLDFNNDGTSKIVFGNGVYGAIPENFPIYAQYAVGGGANTNINTLNVINVYSGGAEKIEGVTNSTTFNGGSDAESMESAKILAPASLKTRDRFVTVDDGLTLIYRTGLSSIAYIWSNYYGSLSCKVNCVARGGGNLSADNKDYIQQYLIDRSVLGSLDVRVVDTVFVTVDLSVDVSLNIGYTLVQVEPYIQICCKLFFTECGKEIVDMYTSSGLEKAIQLINSIFSVSFETSDSQIYNMLEYLTKIGYRKFGETIHESNLVAMISNCVEGINHLVVGNIFPISVARDQITTAGTYTIGEI
jgi:hypothetical protein